MRTLFPGLVRLAFLFSLAVLSQAGLRPAKFSSASTASRAPEAIVPAPSRPCTVCSFNMLTPFHSPTNEITTSNGMIDFTMVFYASGLNMQPNLSYDIATISGGCLPSVNRTTNINYGGRTWEVFITTFGYFDAEITSGSALPAGTIVDLEGAVSQ